MNRTSEQLADEIAARHADYFRKNPKGEIVQTCLIEPEEGEDFYLIECPWGSNPQRMIVLSALRQAMIQLSAARYAIWSEVWLLKKPAPEGQTVEDAIAEHDASYTHGDIAADPARIEAVFTLVVEGKGRVITRTQRIIRGRNGGVRKLEPIEGDDMQNFGGALADLMPERTIN
jgi:hypothetical protein